MNESKPEPELEPADVDVDVDVNVDLNITVNNNTDESKGQIQEEGGVNDHDNDNDDDDDDDDDDVHMNINQEEETKECAPSEPTPTPAPAPQKRMSKIVNFLDCGGGATETIQGIIQTPRLKMLKSISGETKATKENGVGTEAPGEEEEGVYVENSNGEEDEVKVIDEGDDEEEEDDDDESLDEPLEFSDLSDPSRDIWIVTTAALPWRTGTAINPFLRALYLVKNRLDLGLYELESESGAETQEAKEAVSDENIKTVESGVGKVTLVIPWLLDKRHADKLYGPDIITLSGDGGKEQQLDWIRKYADEKCGMAREMKFLNILFYSAAYWPAFGSIFPTVDICSLIPDEEADVAILEEPEHLNWFRVPPPSSSSSAETDEDNYAGPTPVCSKLQVPQVLTCTPSKKKKQQQETILEKNENENDAATSSSESADNNNAQELPPSSAENKKDTELGWAHKFTFVVGVIHTNYSAYMKQYGIGSSIIGAPAISAMSTMVVRAYCHKVVKLSAVIPVYAKWKEITCNVHGVRSDFLGRGSDSDSDGEKDKTKVTGPNSSPPLKDEEEFAPIYFIGKLLWAKGFDRMLKVQELYRESNSEREYFPIDVYGGGPDEKAICRAFHGRLQNSSSSTIGKENLNDQTIEEDAELETFTSNVVFSHHESIRKQLYSLVDSIEDEEDTDGAYIDAKSYINMGFEVVAPSEDKDATTSKDVVVMEPKISVSDKKEDVVDPLSLLSGVTENFAATGIATTEAVINLADSAVKTGIAATFSQEKETDGEELDGDEGLKSKSSFIFDPPKSLFELRRNPIPARFLGVKDHALLRDSPHKIFLNLSVTEVLCTTTAEALAMGKFAIIPLHPSNEFFLQFPNCLAYKNLRECVKKIKWALQNEPTPLSEELAYIFTWEAATNRLIESSYISKREARKRNEDGFDKADSRMAWLHSDVGKKGYFIKTFFGKNSNTKEEENDQEKK